jgi:hypothetical protein
LIDTLPDPFACLFVEFECERAAFGGNNGATETGTAQGGPRQDNGNNAIIRRDSLENHIVVQKELNLAGTYQSETHFRHSGCINEFQVLRRER